MIKKSLLQLQTVVALAMLSEELYKESNNDFVIKCGQIEEPNITMLNGTPKFFFSKHNRVAWKDPYPGRK